VDEARRSCASSTRCCWTSVNQKASDIHFEPYERNYASAPPRRHAARGDLGRRSTSRRGSPRAQGHGRSTTAERRVPQDGRLKMMLSKSRTIDPRQHLSTLYGEKVVLRILDPPAPRSGWSRLGMSPTRGSISAGRLRSPTA